MNTIAALLMLIPPALPPSGPVTGQLQCLFEYESGSASASISFDEDAPPLNQFGQPETAGAQVYLRQIPVDGNKIDYLEFNTDFGITIVAKDSKKILGRFAYLNGASTWGSGVWMKFSIPLENGEMKDLGTCFGTIRGRMERPIKMTKIETFRVDRVYE